MESNTQYKYVVVTAGGTWGIADTLIEAAKNARVRPQYLSASVYRFDVPLIEDIRIDGMGTVIWNWKEHLPLDDRMTMGALRRMSHLGRFKIKITKGEVILKHIE